MKHITKCKTSAIKLAERLLRTQHNVKYLKGKYITPVSTMCYCGETTAILVAAKINKYEHKIVGYCKFCGE